MDDTTRIIDSAIRGAIAGGFLVGLVVLLRYAYNKLKRNKTTREPNPDGSQSSNLVFQNDKHEEAIWAAASKEFEENKKEGLYARCYAEANGDIARTKANYLRERVKQLRIEQHQQSEKSEKKVEDTQILSGYRQESSAPLHAESKAISESTSEFPTTLFLLALAAGAIAIAVATKSTPERGNQNSSIPAVLPWKYGELNGTKYKLHFLPRTLREVPPDSLQVDIAYDFYDGSFNFDTNTAEGKYDNIKTMMKTIEINCTTNSTTVVTTMPLKLFSSHVYQLDKRLDSGTLNPAVETLTSDTDLRAMCLHWRNELRNSK